MLDQEQRQIRPVWWGENGQGIFVRLLDQTLLPQHVSYLQLFHEEEVAEAIRSLRVRGAVSIAVAAAFGLVIALSRQLHEKAGDLGLAEAQLQVQAAGHLLCATRPTAVNLAWAVQRMVQRMEEYLPHLSSAQELLPVLRNEAVALVQEDQEACLHMGQLGASLIADGDTLLTHCNTGILATTGIGTALAPIYVAHRSGKRIHVLVGETRPVLQGARLTAWELLHEGVPVTLITDSMAGYFMRQGRVQAVFVGADRIAANGDVANKIGTYTLAVLATAHHIPFYVVAPRSTLDLSLPTGDHIPVEQRAPEEVTTVQGVTITAAGVAAANPAFDITPHHYVTALITEQGIVRPPYARALQKM